MQNVKATLPFTLPRHFSNFLQNATYSYHACMCVKSLQSCLTFYNLMDHSLPGNPLQYSCLENPMDRGDCQAPVHWVSKNWTQLKPLSTHTCKKQVRRLAWVLGPLDRGLIRPWSAIANTIQRPWCRSWGASLPQ